MRRICVRHSKLRTSTFAGARSSRGSDRRTRNCASAEGRVRDTFAEDAQSFVNHARARTESGKPLTRPVPERMSTQRFIGAEGCDHARRQDCR